MTPLSPVIKINSKCLKTPNYETPRKKQRKMLQDIGVSKYFLHKTLKVQKSKNGQIELH
jgi:hypothetical protein